MARAAKIQINALYNKNTNINRITKNIQKHTYNIIMNSPDVIDKNLYKCLL